MIRIDKYDKGASVLVISGDAPFVLSVKNYNIKAFAHMKEGDTQLVIPYQDIKCRMTMRRGKSGKLYVEELYEFKQD